MTEARARAKIESAIKSSTELLELGETLIWLEEMLKLVNNRFEEIEDEQE